MVSLNSNKYFLLKWIIYAILILVLHILWFVFQNNQKAGINFNLVNIKESQTSFFNDDKGKSSEITVSFNKANNQVQETSKKDISDNNQEESSQQNISQNLQEEVPEAIVLKQEPIQYPTAAIRRNLQGTIILHILVSPNGEIKEIITAQSSGFQVLDTNAVQSVKSWTFANDKEIDIWVSLKVNYVLE